MHRPKIVNVLQAAVIAIFACVAFSAVGECGGPRLVVDQPEHSFGRIPNDRGVEHVFKVKNTGDRPLVITGVRTSCGCTAAMMESSVIEPGGTGNLRVSFSPKGGKTPVTRSITVSSNDPVKKDFTLKVSADPQVASEVDVKIAPVKRTHERKARLDLDGKCAKCHVPQKPGMSGKKLYIAACAKCHGDSGEGIMLDGETLGAAIKVGGTGVRTEDGIRQTITAGTGHPWMPGFGAEYGGPLSEKQVASLVKLVRNKFKEK